MSAFIHAIRNHTSAGIGRRRRRQGQPLLQRRHAHREACSGRQVPQSPGGGGCGLRRPTHTPGSCGGRRRRNLRTSVDLSCVPHWTLDRHFELASNVLDTYIRSASRKFNAPADKTRPNSGSDVDRIGPDFDQLWRGSTKSDGGRIQTNQARSKIWFGPGQVGPNSIGLGSGRFRRIQHAMRCSELAISQR